MSGSVCRRKIVGSHCQRSCGCGVDKSKIWKIPLPLYRCSLFRRPSPWRANVRRAANAFRKIDDLISRVAAAIDGARNCLFSEQHEEGYWCGELEADATLEADYILLHVLGRAIPSIWPWRRATSCSIRTRMAAGAFIPRARRTSAPRSKCYFGLKLAGYAADDPDLVRARKKILEMGG